MTASFAGLNFNGFSRIAEVCNISRDLIPAYFADRGVKFRNKEHVNGIMFYHVLNLLFSKISRDFIFCKISRNRIFADF